MSSGKKQTNSGKNPTHVTSVGVDNYGTLSATRYVGRLRGLYGNSYRPEADKEHGVDETYISNYDARTLPCKEYIAPNCDRINI